MTTGARGRGFFAGAIGGLALALLLVGVVSYLPQPNAARQALSSPAKDAGQGSGAAYNTTHPAASTTTAGAAYVGAGQTSTTSAVPQAPGSMPASVVPGGAAVNTTVTTTKASVTSAAGLSNLASNFGSSQGVSSNGASNAAQARPGSLLTALPGEGVGNLVATLSPLLVGLLVAVLIYSAYSRRQDSSS